MTVKACYTWFVKTKVPGVKTNVARQVGAVKIINFFRFFRRKPKVYYCRYCGGVLEKRSHSAGFDTHTGKPCPPRTYWECSAKGNYVCAHATELHVW